MTNENNVLHSSLITIPYDLIRELSLFQEQYDRLTAEIQQVKVQLANSPPLEDDSPRAHQREEWRAWLEMQIRSKQRERDALLLRLRHKSIVVDNLPE